MKKDKMMYFFVFFLIAVCGYFIYSFVSKNPNNYFNGNNLIFGEYLIKNKRIRIAQPGTFSGKDSLVEPSSSKSLYLLNKKNNENILIECSIFERECPFYNMYDQEVLVGYITSKFFSRKYAYYLKINNEIYDERYFIKKYKNENSEKIYFMVFYIFLYFVILYFFYFEIKRKIK